MTSNVTKSIIETKFNNLALFTTKTCPNCKIAKMILDSSGLKYDIVDAEENLEKTKLFQIQKVPTLVTVGPNQDYNQFNNISDIKKFIKG